MQLRLVIGNIFQQQKFCFNSNLNIQLESDLFTHKNSIEYQGFTLFKLPVLHVHMHSDYKLLNPIKSRLEIHIHHHYCHECINTYQYIVINRSLDNQQKLVALTRH
ncbi:hypothetical protein SAY87_005135 [Trapa incisa]|uniref:Uncharacterized protein n=1 Tax=Trapa incisa TaxID=236973 RepID=A0AAN7K5X1_9MYRT|nr:hypothetical protein SAY87_005135 [Trapa incisa]